MRRCRAWVGREVEVVQMREEQNVRAQRRSKVARESGEGERFGAGTLGEVAREGQEPTNPRKQLAPPPPPMTMFDIDIDVNV